MYVKWKVRSEFVNLFCCLFLKIVKINGIDLEGRQGNSTDSYAAFNFQHFSFLKDLVELLGLYLVFVAFVCETLLNLRR
jgi:hypothetical protein